MCGGRWVVVVEDVWVEDGGGGGDGVIGRIWLRWVGNTVLVRQVGTLDGGEGRDEGVMMVVIVV